MQTFLPDRDFAECARLLDRKRLNKQIVEVYQILNAITKPGAKGWINHPCTNMWRPHVPALVQYGIAMCDEAVRRGIKCTLIEKLPAFAPDYAAAEVPAFVTEELCTTHRANLLRKDFEFYSQYGWTENPETPYFWPSA